MGLVEGIGDEVVYGVVTLCVLLAGTLYLSFGRVGTRRENVNEPDPIDEVPMPRPPSPPPARPVEVEENEPPPNDNEESADQGPGQRVTFTVLVGQGQRTVSLNVGGQRVQDLKRQVAGADYQAFAAEVSAGQTVLLVFRGRLLADHQLLCDLLAQVQQGGGPVDRLTLHATLRGAAEQVPEARPAPALPPMVSSRLGTQLIFGSFLALFWLLALNTSAISPAAMVMALPLTALFAVFARG